MRTYLVSYDLKSPGKDYNRLYTHLKSYSTWAKPLESLWLIKSDLTATAVRDNVQSFVDSNDKVLVIEVTKNRASYNLAQDVVNWMAREL